MRLFCSASCAIVSKMKAYCIYITPAAVQVQEPRYACCSIRMTICTIIYIYNM